MKLKNVVAGTQVEAKRNTTGECGEPIIKGAVLDVTRVLELSAYDPYRVRVDAEYLEDGYAYVDPADFRKAKEVTEKPTEHVYEVGNKVLVGSEGAGYGHIDRDLANKVCTVTALEDGCLRIAHPLVTTPRGYLTYPRYVSPYVEPKSVKEFQKGVTVRITRTHKAWHGEQVQAGDVCKVLHKFEYTPDMYTVKHPNGIGGQVTIHQDDLELVEEPEINPQVGDWLVGVADADSNVQQGVAYKVVGFSTCTGRVGIALHTHSEAAWQKVYFINREDYSKVLREVKPDADTST